MKAIKKTSLSKRLLYFMRLPPVSVTAGKKTVFAVPLYFPFIDAGKKTPAVTDFWSASGLSS